MVFEGIGRFIGGIVTRVKEVFKPKVEQRGAPVLKPTETKAARSFERRTGREPTIAPEPERRVSKRRREEEPEVPEGRVATDVEAEIKLRDQGLMTVQTGVDALGFPLTQVIPISGFQERSAEAQKAEADLAVNILLKGFIATPSAIFAASSFVNSFKGLTGKTGKIGIISKTAGVVNPVQVSTKTTQQTASLLSKFFSKKALAVYVAWATSVGVGLYAQAEAPESISINMNKFLIPEAKRTGDWTAVDEANALAEEITDLSIWEKIILASPFSVIAGAWNKLRGNAAGVQIQIKYSEDQKEKQTTGGTEAQYWEKRREEEKADDKATIDYYNEERKKLLEWEREAEVAGRNDDAIFWRKEREAQMKREAEDRQAIADFWLAYKKQAQKIADNNRPSKLNFGLL